MCNIIKAQAREIPSHGGDLLELCVFITSWHRTWHTIPWKQIRGMDLQPGTEVNRVVVYKQDHDPEAWGWIIIPLHNIHTVNWKVTWLEAKIQTCMLTMSSSWGMDTACNIWDSSGFSDMERDKCRHINRTLNLWSSASVANQVYFFFFGFLRHWYCGMQNIINLKIKQRSCGGWKTSQFLLLLHYIVHVYCTRLFCYSILATQLHWSVWTTWAWGKGGSIPFL